MAPVKVKPSQIHMIVLKSSELKEPPDELVMDGVVFRIDNVRWTSLTADGEEEFHYSFRRSESSTERYKNE